jgi:hypothetical protein
MAGKRPTIDLRVGQVTQITINGVEVASWTVAKKRGRFRILAQLADGVELKHSKPVANRKHLA